MVHWNGKEYSKHHISTNIDILDIAINSPSRTEKPKLFYKEKYNWFMNPKVTSKSKWKYWNLTNVDFPVAKISLSSLSIEFNWCFDSCLIQQPLLFFPALLYLSEQTKKVTESLGGKVKHFWLDQGGALL